MKEKIYLIMNLIVNKKIKIRENYNFHLMMKNFLKKLVKKFI